MPARGTGALAPLEVTPQVGSTNPNAMKLGGEGLVDMSSTEPVQESAQVAATTIVWSDGAEGDGTGSAKLSDEGTEPQPDVSSRSPSFFLSSS